MGDTPWNHWYVKGAVPSTVTENVTLPPWSTVAPTGCPVMAGGPDAAFADGEKSMRNTKALMSMAP
jgi:hypothetical protein